MNTIKPDFDVKKDTESNQDTEANLDTGANMDTGANQCTEDNLDAENSMDVEHDINIDFDTKLNMARAMVKVLNDMDLVDCFTSVSARSMRNEDDKVAYMAMREELLRRMQNEDK